MTVWEELHPLTEKFERKTYPFQAVHWWEEEEDEGGLQMLMSMVMMTQGSQKIVMVHRGMKRAASTEEGEAKKAESRQEDCGGGERAHLFWDALRRCSEEKAMRMSAASTSSSPEWGAGVKTVSRSFCSSSSKWVLRLFAFA